MSAATKAETQPTVGSLFAGIGGLDLGFERAGFKSRWQVEKDPWCRRVLAKNFPAAERFNDVHACGIHNLCPVDVICGGDPCQENSNARQAFDTTSPSLGGEFIRIVDELRPRIVLRENPSVVRADAPWPWFRFRAELERLGYAVLPFELRACCVGLDHKRERLFLLAALPDAGGTRLEGNEREELERAYRRQGHGADASRPDRRSATPRVCGRAHGIQHRMDRLRGLGNAVSPQMAEIIARCVAKALIQPKESDR